MDVMEKLREMAKASDEALPYVPNMVRQNLDFSIVPGMVYQDGHRFIDNCLEGKEEFICALFCHYYEKMNPVYYGDDPKVFRSDDFYVGHRVIGEHNHLVVATLPDEFMGSSEFCRAYVIAYSQVQGKKENVQFYAIADSAYGWLRIYRITDSGEQVFLGRATGRLSEDIQVITKAAFG